MTVYDNLAFPLRCRNFTDQKIEERVKSVSEFDSIFSTLSTAVVIDSLSHPVWNINSSKKNIC